MPFQVYIKTERSVQQLAAEIRDALSLPPFSLDAFAEEPYCQFDMFGMQIMLHYTDQEMCDPEVKQYAYSFDLQMSFTEHELNTDDLEHNLQPYFAQLLAFRLGFETAYRERKKVGPHWQVRYCHCTRNPHWDGTILFGEPGWEPAVTSLPSGPWRTMRSPF